MTYFLVAAILTGLFSLWLTRWIFRGDDNSRTRWTAFAIVWVIALALSYIPASK